MTVQQIEQGAKLYRDLENRQKQKDALSNAINREEGGMIYYQAHNYSKDTQIWIPQECMEDVLKSVRSFVDGQINVLTNKIKEL